MPPEPPLPVRPFVTDFLRESGRVVSAAMPLQVGGAGSSLLVEDDHGTLTVSQVDATGTREVRLRTQDPRVVETFLVMAAAADWRRAHSRRRLGDRRLRRPRSHHVVGHDDGAAAVQGPDGTTVARDLRQPDARRLAAALDHPVGAVVAGVKEKRGRPVWTGSTLVPVVASFVVTLAAVTAKAVSEIRQGGAGSWEAAVGITLGLLLCGVVAVGYVVGTRRGRRRTEAVLDRDRLGSPRWRCLGGPGFAAAAAQLGVRTRLPTRRQVEMTLVEAPAALEVWRGGGPAPLLAVPWHDIASVDGEPVVGAGPHAGLLVVRTRGGGRVPLIPLRGRTGGQRGATADVVEEYASHLRARTATPSR